MRLSGPFIKPVPTNAYLGESKGGNLGINNSSDAFNGKPLEPAAVKNQGPEGLNRMLDIYGEKKLKQLGVIPCVTCESRVYQDQSDDPGVSFKTPTKVSPEASYAAVLSHELEHVSREQSKAEVSDREVISQSVTLHRAMCPECGKSYVAGGVTKTTTAGVEKADASLVDKENPYDEKIKGSLVGAHLDLKV